MTDAVQIIEQIGRRRLARELGLRPTAISEAVGRRIMPARWAKVVRLLHPDAPDEAFNFIQSAAQARPSRRRPSPPAEAEGAR